eukprot:750751-Hanusia_phi.AAC.1
MKTSPEKSPSTSVCRLPDSCLIVDSCSGALEDHGEYGQEHELLATARHDSDGASYSCGRCSELLQVDQDKTGSIDFEEFKQIMANDLNQDPLLAQMSEARRIFEMFDTDGSGSIDLFELSQGERGQRVSDALLKLGTALKVLGRSMNDAEVKQLMKAADEDGGGEIDFAEFCDLIGISLSNDARKVLGFGDFCSSRALPQQTKETTQTKSDAHKARAAGDAVRSSREGLSEKQKQKLQEVNQRRLCLAFRSASARRRKKRTDNVSSHWKPREQVACLGEDANRQATYLKPRSRGGLDEVPVQHEREFGRQSRRWYFTPVRARNRSLQVRARTPGSRTGQFDAFRWEEEGAKEDEERE